MHDAISMGGIHAYYVSRLLQCIQEIAVHPRLSKKEKYERISEILNDTQTQESLKKAIPDSKLMRLVLLPMNWKSVFWSYNEGKAIGFVKNHMSGFFTACGLELYIRQGRKNVEDKKYCCGERNCWRSYSPAFGGREK